MLSQLLPEGLASNQTAFVMADDHSPPLRDTDRSRYTLSYWEPLRTKKVAWTITEAWETTRGWAALNGKIHLLHKCTLMRPGEAAVLPNAQKPKRVKENEETEEYVANKRTRQISRNGDRPFTWLNIQNNGHRIGGKLLDISLGNDFLDLMWKAKATTLMMN